MKCPDCDELMVRCDEGHPHNIALAELMFPNQPAKDRGMRGERDPHWTCSNADHDLVEVFDDGQVVRI